MIEMVLLGAAIGAVLFWLWLVLVPRQDSALVQLAKLDAMFADTGAGRPEPVTSAPARGRAGVEAKLGGLVSAFRAAAQFSEGRWTVLSRYTAVVLT